MRPKGLMTVHTGATVHADVAITLYVPPDTGDECVSIFFGEEQLSLDFYDPMILGRLRDLADEGVRELRARIDANAESDVDSPEPAG